MLVLSAGISKTAAHSARQDRPEKCLICHQKAFGYNFDVVSCNACKMFFRRALAEPIDEYCRKDGKCFERDDLEVTRPKCRPCRFQKCIDLGMKPTRDPKEPTKEPIISCLVTQGHRDCSVIDKLFTLNQTRSSVYSVINICENPSFRDMVVADSRLGVFARPRSIYWENTERKMKPWGSLGVMLVVEIIKTMDFFNELLLSDRVLVLKNTAFKSHHLSIAFDSYTRKKGKVLTPHDGEMFPPLLLSIPECEPMMYELVTNPLRPLIELNITEIEYLLLNMIIICNPGVQGLSPGGQSTLSTYQQLYSRLLFHRCMLSNPKNGPSRFAALLSINQTLDRQIKIMQLIDYMLRKHWDAEYLLPEILYESCRMDSFRMMMKKKEMEKNSKR